MPNFEPQVRDTKTEGLINWMTRMVKSGDEHNARKTVTFGDAAAVRSSGLSSLIASFAIIFAWFIFTTGSDPIINGRTFPSLSSTWSGLRTWLDEGYRNQSIWEHTFASLR
jgi:hypothetical protein